MKAESARGWTNQNEAWVFLNFLVLSCSGFAVGIYSTNSPEACHYVAHDCEANICVVENDAQLQKILQVRDRLPHLRAIIQYRGELSKKYSNVYTVSTISYKYPNVYTLSTIMIQYCTHNTWFKILKFYIVYMMSTIIKKRCQSQVIMNGV